MESLAYADWLVIYIPARIMLPKVPWRIHPRPSTLPSDASDSCFSDVLIRIARRFTARNALLALLCWPFVALVVHLKAELRDGYLTEKEFDADSHKERRTAVVVAKRAEGDASW